MAFHAAHTPIDGVDMAYLASEVMGRIVGEGERRDVRGIPSRYLYGHEYATEYVAHESGGRVSREVPRLSDRIKVSDYIGKLVGLSEVRVRVVPDETGEKVVEEAVRLMGQEMRRLSEEAVGKLATAMGGRYTEGTVRHVAERIVERGAVRPTGVWFTSEAASLVEGTSAHVCALTREGVSRMGVASSGTYGWGEFMAQSQRFLTAVESGEREEMLSALGGADMVNLEIKSMTDLASDIRAARDSQSVTAVVHSLTGGRALEEVLSASGEFLRADIKNVVADVNFQVSALPRVEGLDLADFVTAVSERYDGAVGVLPDGSLNWREMANAQLFLEACVGLYAEDSEAGLMRQTVGVSVVEFDRLIGFDSRGVGSGQQVGEERVRRAREFACEVRGNGRGSEGARVFLGAFARGVGATGELGGEAKALGELVGKRMMGIAEKKAAEMAAVREFLAAKYVHDSLARERARVSESGGDLGAQRLREMAFEEDLEKLIRRWAVGGGV